jgi:hypothetical protein
MEGITWLDTWGCPSPKLDVVVVFLRADLLVDVILIHEWSEMKMTR